MFPKSVLPIVVLLVVCWVGQSCGSRNAHPPNCEEDYFMCPGVRRHHPTCIPDSWLCDDDHDCAGGEDEQGCETRAVTCEDGEFLCTNQRECIPDSWMCDGEQDCDDESDETPQACAARRVSAQQDADDDDSDDEDEDGDDTQGSHNSEGNLRSFRHTPHRRHNRQ